MSAFEKNVARSVTRRSAVPWESVDARMLALTRCALAFSALVIIYIDPSEPARLVGLTYFFLSVYCAYGVVVALLSFRKGWPAPPRSGHWLDILFYLCFIALTEGTSSIFFYFFFFSILVASFSYGFREGLLVTVVSAVCFLPVGMLSAPTGAEFELNRTLIRPIYLFALGYMIARLGGHEILLKRRLMLLQEVSNIGHPRFGVEHTVGINLDRLLEFYEADLCVLVLQRPSETPTYTMFTASPTKPARAAAPSDITREMASPLLQLSNAQAATYRDLRLFWGKRSVHCAVYEMNVLTRQAGMIDVCARLAVLLDTPSFVTTPYAQRDGTHGRIYVASSTNTFARTDVDFISQWTGTLSPVVENLQLMNDLIAKAAEHERYKISRDLHDSTIQPYIGLKLGLEALYRGAGPGNALAGKISELIHMATLTISDLRAYAAMLRETAPLPGDFLVAAIKEQVERYRKFFGIEVEIKTDINARLTGRIAAEAYQIIVEGLSNILKHTSAKRAFVTILCEPEYLLVKIANEHAEMGGRPANFTPRSINDRAQSLHGAILVEQGIDGYTVVHVTIPI